MREGNVCILQNIERKKEIFNNKLLQTMPNMNIKKFTYNMEVISKSAFCKCTESRTFVRELMKIRLIRKMKLCIDLGFDNRSLFEDKPSHIINRRHFEG